jgi:hypothetical protein
MIPIAVTYCSLADLLKGHPCGFINSDLDTVVANARGTTFHPVSVYAVAGSVELT